MRFRWELGDFRCVLGENRGGLLVSKVVFAKLQPVPESLLFLRKTTGSGPMPYTGPLKEKKRGHGHSLQRDLQRGALHGIPIGRKIGMPYTGSL